MHQFDIDLDMISKVEGTAKLVVRVKEGKVEKVQFKAFENKRFYTQGSVGQNCLAMPQLVSRICGTCSIAHLMCSIEAVEKALGVKVTEQTMKLKKLAMYGLMVRDHPLHLYFFSLPDVIGKDSVLDFDTKDEFENKMLHDAFDVKKAGNELSKLVCGRAVHGTYPTIGGFIHLPSKEDVAKVIKMLKEVRPKVLDIIKVYADWDEELIRDTTFVALKADEFGFLEGKLHSTTGKVVEEKDFRKHLEHVVIPYSQASGYSFEGEEYMVGALARINLSKELLHSKTKKDCAKYLKMFPSNNIFHNNLAQAIETLHAIDHSLEILENTEFVKEELPHPKPKKGVGVGVIEAPRGTLYHKIVLDEKGIVTKAEFVVPTGQNQVHIENDLKQMIESNLGKMDKEEMTLEAEKIIRAYDPCMSCASHFLELDWSEN